MSRNERLQPKYPDGLRLERGGVLSVLKPDLADHDSMNGDARLVRRQRHHGRDGSGSGVRPVGAHRFDVVDARLLVALGDVLRLGAQIVLVMVCCSCVRGLNRYDFLESQGVAQCRHVVERGSYAR